MISIEDRKKIVELIKPGECDYKKVADEIIRQGDRDGIQRPEYEPPRCKKGHIMFDRDGVGCGTCQAIKYQENQDKTAYHPCEGCGARIRNEFAKCAACAVFAMDHVHICPKCKAEIKARPLFATIFVGCLC